MKEIMAKALGDLPKKEKEVMALYYYEELTLREIGEVLGVVESRVSQLRSAALVRLRARMQDLLGARPPQSQLPHGKEQRCKKS
jgi:RNA polymerase sigma factor for flagellar operon FliA